MLSGALAAAAAYMMLKKNNGAPTQEQYSITVQYRLTLLTLSI